jgi:hypothetical protein
MARRGDKKEFCDLEFAKSVKYSGCLTDTPRRNINSLDLKMQSSLDVSGPFILHPFYSMSRKESPVDTRLDGLHIWYDAVVSCQKKKPYCPDRPYHF